MKIYLFTNAEWQLFENPSAEDLKQRKIVIAPNANIGYYAKIGYSANIGDYAKIGYYAKITKTATDCSAAHIYQQLGVMPDATGYLTLYKSVSPDLTSFHDVSFQYAEGSEWKDASLQRNQAIECGEGCHFTTYDRAVAFAATRNHIIIEARIHLDDVLAVHQKVRVKAFRDVRIVTLEM